MPGFAALLARVAGNGVKVAIVESANRFARDLIVQETGHRMLRNLGIELIAADSPDSFVDDTPTAILVRQILGAVAQFEKAALVAKLKGARERVRRQRGKCEGRKSHVEPGSGECRRAIGRGFNRPPFARATWDWSRSVDGTQCAVSPDLALIDRTEDGLTSLETSQLHPVRERRACGRHVCARHDDGLGLILGRPSTPSA